MSKTTSELQQEYTKACLDLGNLEYQNSVMDRQIENNCNEAEKLKQRMRRLSKEASELEAAAEVTNEAQS